MTHTTISTIRVRENPQPFAKESRSSLALLPVLATIAFYALPGHWQQERFWQFVPQLVAFGSLGLWLRRNSHPIHRLGLEKTKIGKGLSLGLSVGVLLGGLNTLVILHAVPALGFDIDFLRDTPHARVPPAIMVPWLIMVIAGLVELNFRGFLLGRLTAWLSIVCSEGQRTAATTLAVGITALTFAFDPFMVATFRHLHWVALWDGLIWGWLRMQTGNLYVVITAHAVEVMIEYLVIRAALS